VLVCDMRGGGSGPPPTSGPHGERHGAAGRPNRV